MKFDQDKYLKLEKEFDKEKKERIRWEVKVTDIDSDLVVSFFMSSAQLHNELLFYFFHRQTKRISKKLKQH